MRLGIIGTGNVGASFLLALRPILSSIGIVSSHANKTNLQARQWHVTPYTLETIAAASDVLLLTVRDDVLPTLAEQVSHHLDGHNPIVLHCSGALDTTVLQAVQQKGCPIGSLHPLQTVCRPQAQIWQGVYFAIDGMPLAQQAARTLVQWLGGHSFTLTAAARPTYHAAACLASNYIVTIYTLAQQLLAPFLSTGDAATALAPLLNGTVQHLCQASTSRTALTGPIARGDIHTLTKHLHALPPEYIDLYISLGIPTAALALQNKTISSEQYQAILSIFRNVKGANHAKNNTSDHS